MNVQEFTIDELQIGQRIDNFLFKHYKGVPKSRVYRALRGGEVRVNRKRIKQDYRLCEGDIVRLPPLRQGQPRQQPRVHDKLRIQIEQAIIFEDADLLVLNKPAGIAVHGGSGISLGVIEVLRQVRPKAKYLELCHRIDKATSGCLLIAKKPSILKEIHNKFKEKSINKMYLALVSGSWPRRLRTISEPLQKNTLQSGERIVRVQKDGRAAVTKFTIIKKFAGTTLVAAVPETGRTHQIRVHCQHAGCPIVGDEKYGGPKAKRLFLHAAEIGFECKEKDKNIAICSCLDKIYLNHIKALRH